MSITAIQIRRFVGIKKRVLDTVGSLKTLPFMFRSEQIFQNYTALCGEIEMSKNDADALEDETLNMLEDYANKVISLYKERYPNGAPIMQG